MIDKRIIIERLFSLVTSFFAMCVVVLTTFIIGLVLINGLDKLTWDFLTLPPTGTMDGGGILPIIEGTVMLVLLMSLISVPFGTAIALYLNEVSSKGAVYNYTMSSVRTLAAVPSIVYGLFGLAFFVNIMGGGLDFLFGYEERVFRERCLLWAAMTMGVLTLPINIIAVTEALKMVPQEQRHAGLCFGYTSWEVIKWIVFPQAKGGILTGLVLSVSRGFWSKILLGRSPPASQKIEKRNQGKSAS